MASAGRIVGEVSNLDPGEVIVGEVSNLDPGEVIVGEVSNLDPGEVIVGEVSNLDPGSGQSGLETPPTRLGEAICWTQIF